ncbi:TetR/AcrR family transcriptional regulator [Bacteroidota bacterium]
MKNNTQNREPDTEHRILEAAAKVFMMKGKLGASMQDIADEAGINRTLLHYYFRNKDKLFDTVFEEVFAQLFPAMVGIMASDRPLEERISMFIEAYTNLLREKPYLPVFVFQEISLNPERLTGYIQGVGIDPRHTLDKLKAELEAIGLAGMDPRHIFASMMGMVLFPYIGRPLFQAIAFQGDKDAYENFLSERSSHIPQFMKLAFIGAGSQKKKS